MRVLPSGGAIRKPRAYGRFCPVHRRRKFLLSLKVSSPAKGEERDAENPIPRPGRLRRRYLRRAGGKCHSFINAQAARGGFAPPGQRSRRQAIQKGGGDCQRDFRATSKSRRARRHPDDALRHPPDLKQNHLRAQAASAAFFLLTAKIKKLSLLR